LNCKKSKQSLNALTSPKPAHTPVSPSTASSWPSAADQRDFYQSLLSQVRQPVAYPTTGRELFYRSVLAATPVPLAGLPEVEPPGAPAQLVAPVQPSTEPVSVAPVADKSALSPVPEKAKDQPAAPAWSTRLRQGLSKTRGRLAAHLSTLFRPGVKIDAELLEDIESELLSADVGIEATDRIMAQLQEQAKANQVTDADALYQELRSEMLRILSVSDSGNPLLGDLSHHPFVLLVIGVNGVGKTTTIGKIAKFQRDQGRSVILAAGDTFRAAAVDQLKTWGQRLEVPVIAQETGADSAAVVFDALNAAKARKADLLIADTAGRLHTQEHLMDELRKVKRVLQKIDPEAPHGVLLVLDAGNGQNALNQAKVFHEAMAVSGIALTKLDGTAKGGISFAICQTLKLPLWFIGVGEQADDLRPFVAEDFVDALLNQQK
jgi:fused signal recognition particle receptor